ncbi:MAG: hypothetical protein AABW91_04015 [Nanoarchaeota archaeon]
MRTYHIRKITNGKPGEYLVQIPSEESRLGEWRRENAGAQECEKKEANGIRNMIYYRTNIQTRLEKISDI